MSSYIPHLCSLLFQTSVLKSSLLFKTSVLKMVPEEVDNGGINGKTFIFYS